MSISDFCINQRQHEAEQLKKFLCLSLTSSALLHAGLAFALMELPTDSYLSEEPIELIIVEQPEPELTQSETKPIEEVSPKPLVQTPPPDTFKPFPLEPVTPPPEPKPQIAPSPEPTQTKASPSVVPPKEATLPSPKPLPAPVKPQPIARSPLPPLPTQPIEEKPPQLSAASPSVPPSSAPKPSQIAPPLANPSTVSPTLKEGLSQSSSTPAKVTEETPSNVDAFEPNTVGSNTPPIPKVDNIEPLSSTDSSASSTFREEFSQSPSNSRLEAGETTPDTSDPGTVASNSAPPPKVGNIAPPLSSSPSASSPFKEELSQGSSAPTAATGESTPGIDSADLGAVAANSPVPRPPQSSGNGSGSGVSCLSNCQPDYPSSLDGAEGSAAVKITIDGNGNVIGAALDRSHTNSQLNQEALAAAKRMKFSPPKGNNPSAVVRVTINFTVAGSDFDRLARERQEELERKREQ